MRFVILCLIILFGSTCKSSKLNLGKECMEYEKKLLEFASKIEPLGDSCIVFRFDPDTLKYNEYRFIRGRELFLNYKVYESLYLQQQLTNNYDYLSDLSKKCMSKISKEQIIKLFGKNYLYRSFENTLYYNICITKKPSHANGIVTAP